MSACPGDQPLAVVSANQHDGNDSAFEAGTVVVLRDIGGETGRHMQCLMLRKTEGQAFGGLWVFPGGRVEDDDGRGLAGARGAAVREAMEETGLRLDPDALVPMSYWIPPPDAPRRYLTWFFVAPVPGDRPNVVIDGGEIGDHVWTGPAAALQAHARREIKLLPPTWMTLHRLSSHGDVASSLRDAAGRPIERFATYMVDSREGPVALWYPDAAYPPSRAADPGDLDAPGPRHRLYMDPAGWRYQRS